MKNDKFKETLLGPLNKNNPVVVQVLGICSALAVTVQLKPAIVMGLSVTIIVALANVIISLLRNTIPNSVRIIVQLVVVAAVVTVQEIVAGPFSPCFGGKVRGQLYLEIHSGSKVDDFRPDCKSGRTERLPSDCRIAANQAERLPNGDLMANQAERLSDCKSGGTLRKACLFEAAASDEAPEQ